MFRKKNITEEKNNAENGKALINLHCVPFLRKSIGGLFLTLFLFICGLAVGLFYYGLTDIYPHISKAHADAETIFLSMDENSLYGLESTKIYDKDGVVISEIGGMNCINVPISEISDYIKDAYIAMEDRTFYEHEGLNYQAILRASILLLQNDRIVQGGSTITQQVIKNNLLSQEQTVERKLREAFLAPWVNQIYTKDEILEAYCNTNYFGNNCYGVEVASQYYFGKTAKDVSLSEAAILTSLSARPSACNPKTNLSELMTRRNLTLDTMLECKVISQEEYNEAVQETPVFVYQDREQPHTAYVESYAIHAAATELMDQDGFSFQYMFSSEKERELYQREYETAYTKWVEELRSGGYDIYTSIDMNQQQVLQKAVDTTLSENQELRADGRYALQGAAVAIDNKTGCVTAIVGGRGTHDEFNRAYMSYRQPASVIKPLLVFAPAFEKGYTEQMTMTDEAFAGSPKNAYDDYLGDITMREALARSTNTIAYKVLKNITPAYGMSFLNKMEFYGITSEDRQKVLNALGAFDYGTRVVDIAKGYATIANSGIYSDQTCILDIVNGKKGSILIMKPETTRVYSQRTAQMITNCMSDVVNKPYGTGYESRINGVNTAAKTGTTNENKDTWFAGFSAEHTVAVWVGYDMPHKIPNITANTYAGTIWKNFLSKDVM